MEPSSLGSGPTIVDESVYPTKVQPGDVITVHALIYDERGIVMVQGIFSHETGADSVNLSLISGTMYRGIWEGQWMVHDTVEKEYTTRIIAHSSTGVCSSKKITWWDPPKPWWNMAWTYRKMLNVTNPVANYQMLLTVGFNSGSTSYDVQCNGKCNTNFSDLRFTASDGVSLRSYWVERKTNGDNCRVWINTSGDLTIYMYYGNAHIASQSNGNTTFLFFDDFTGSSLDATKWDQMNSGTGSITVNQGNITIASGGDWWSSTDNSRAIVSKISFNSNYIVETFVVNYGTDGYNRFFGVRSSAATDAKMFVLLVDSDRSHITNVYRDSISGSANWYGENTGVANPGSNKVAKFVRNGNTVEAYYDESLANSRTVTSWNLTYVSLTDTAGISNPTKFDWIRVRKYSLPEPTWGSVGPEEVALPTRPVLLTPQNNCCIQDDTPPFHWTTGQNQVNNTLYVSNLSDFSVKYINVSLSESTQNYTPTVGETLPEGKWFWRVVANNTQGSNTSEDWSFIVDKTSPLPVTLLAPANNSASDSSSTTFRWLATTDSTINTTDVSNIVCYQLQVDTNPDCSSPFIDENTSTNTTLSLTETVLGTLFWRVRAWDNAGNAGEFSEIQKLTIFNYTLSADQESLQILRGSSASTSLSIQRVFGDAEGITLIGQWQGLQPVGINVTLSKQMNLTDFTSMLSFETSGDADTGEFIYQINSTSASYINRSIEITVRVIGMSYLLLANPSTVSLIRSDSGQSTVSVIFMIGAKETVSLSGSWQGSTTPSDVSVTVSPISGVPSYESTIRFTTGSNASAGMFVYRVTSVGGGLTQWADISVEIKKTITLTVTSDKDTYEKGQMLQLSGTAQDPEGNPVERGRATLEITKGNFSYHCTTMINNGIFGIQYYISFDKPDGEWTISVTAKDDKGDETETEQTTTISVKTPEIYEHYSMGILSPSAGQMFQRGDIITFSVSISNSMNERVTEAEVQAVLTSGQILTFSEGPPGIYSNNYIIGYDYPSGETNLYVEAKKNDQDKLKAGFTYVNFKVSSVPLIINLLQLQPGRIVETGETVSLKIEVIYPNGIPVDQSIITTTNPVGEELDFTQSNFEQGVYTISYVPSEKEIGPWVVIIHGEDAYGNAVSGQLIQIDIVHMQFVNYLIQYWWAVFLGSILFAFWISFPIRKKLGFLKLRLVNENLAELYSLKQKNAIFYYSDYLISRETYEHLFQEYERKIAQLSKKQRILERRYGVTKHDKKT